jgi:predicted NBD/HSP70 family sugar kinase
VARPVSSSTDQLRRDNTSLVLRSLRRHGPATRAELAQRTGLAKATVGAIVGDLLDVHGVVQEADDTATVQGARGRPGRPVALRVGVVLSLGFEVNVDYVSAVVVDLTGDLVSSETRATSPADAADVLVDLARDLHARLVADGGRPVGAAVAVPALVRDDRRTVAWAPNLPVHGAALAERLQDVLPGCPVQVSNDANCAAYAEAHHGSARGVDDALYLTGTVGIGAGIVVDGDLVTGSSGFAGEVGHMPVGDPEALCGCGRRGCWEASIGLYALLAAVGMSELETPVLTAGAVAARAQDDAGTRATLTRLGRDLGLGVAILANVLDPEVVVLGGYFVPLGELVLESARDEIDARLASTVQVRPEMRLGSLGIEAAAIGAAEQAFADVLAGRAELP